MPVRGKKTELRSLARNRAWRRPVRLDEAKAKVQLGRKSRSHDERGDCQDRCHGRMVRTQAESDPSLREERESMKPLVNLSRALLVTASLTLPTLAFAETPPKHDSAEKSAQKDKAKTDKAKSHAKKKDADKPAP
jgi:hypothetical protein